MWLPVGVMGVLLGLLVLPPIGVLLESSLTEMGPDGQPGPFTLVNYALLFADPKLYSSAWHSVVFAVLATLVSLLFGGLLAWIVERTNAPLKPLAYLTAIISLGTPYVVYVSAWLFLLGRPGPFNDIPRQIFGTTDLYFNVYSMWGMVMVEGFLWSPLVFLLLSATFRRSNAEMEEAARMCGGSVIRTVWHVSMQLARPAIIGISLFVFIRNLESFDVPVLIGTPSKINLLTSDVYLSLTQVPPKVGHASAFSVVLIVVVAILLHYYGKVTRNADKFASITGKGYRPRPFDLGRGRWIGGGIVLLNFLIVLVLPMLGVLWSSLTPFARPMNLAGLKSLNIANYGYVFSQPSYLQLALNSVIVSAAAATAAVLLSMIAAWLAVRRWPGGVILDQITSLPLTFPGIVLGVAMIEMALRSPIPIYGTLWVIALAFLIRYLPYGMRYAYSGVLQIHRELEEAAGVAGASQPTILRLIVAPLLSPAMIAGWLFIFLLGARELSIAVLLSGTNSKTMAVGMYDQLANGQGGEAAALGVVWTVLMSFCATGLYFVSRRQSGIQIGS